MQQWEVKQFYTLFGLEPDKAKNELPDHIVNELEFMHFLSHQAVEASRGLLGDPDSKRRFVHAQKDFLERHLVQWVPKYCAALREKLEPFYLQLAALTARFIDDDLDWVTAQYETS